MARSPQGVSSFIPQIQPYQVDFNFVNNVLKTKQNQYDQNWKSLNKIYGQIYYADLTHEDSKEKQKAIVDQVDFNLKRVAGLDLSLDQNVIQAQQVFQPFYEDSNLMKDMAWTKNTKGQLGAAESMRSSSEEDRRNQYWGTGVDAINYKMQEFKETPYDQIQSVGNVKYTPYVDVMKKADEITASYGDRVTPSFEGGKWIVKTTNGEQLIGPLSKLLNLRLGNDPFIKDMYQTQSYVQRQNYIGANAANFGGDKVATERSYLQDGYEKLKNNTLRQNENLRAQSQSFTNQIEKLENKQKENPGDPRLAAAIRELQYNKQVTEGNLASSDKAAGYYKNGLSNGSTSTGSVDPFEDIGALRNKVDNLVAGDLFNKDMGEAAVTYAYRNYSQDVEVNPYGLASTKHGYAMEEKRYAAKLAMKKSRFEASEAKKLQLEKMKMDSGDFRFDEDFNIVPKEEMFNVQTEMSDTPGFTKEGNIIRATESITTDLYRDEALPKANQQLVAINNSGIDQETLSGYFKGQNLNALVNATKSPEALKQAIDSGEITANTRAEALRDIDEGLIAFYGVESNQETLKATYANQPEMYTSLQENKTGLDLLTKQLTAQEKWQQEAMTTVSSQAVKDGNYEAAAIIDNSGKTRDVNQWAQHLLTTGQIDEATKNKLIANNGEVVSEDRPGTQYAMVPGANFIKELFTGDAIGVTTLKDRNGDNLISYAEAVEDLDDYSVDYGPIGLAPILSGQLNPGDPTDITSLQQSKVTVKGKGSSYNRFAKPVFSNVGNMDFGGKQANPSSYLSYDVNGFLNDEPIVAENQSSAMAVLRAVEGELQDTDSKEAFNFTSSPIAARDPNKQSVTIRPKDPSYWDKFARKDGDEGLEKPGLLSISEIQNLKQNGLSVVSDRSNWDNELTSHVTKDPLVTVMENDPDGKYEVSNMFDDRFNSTYQMNKETKNISFTTTQPVYDDVSLSWGTNTVSEPVSNPSNLSQRINVVNTYEYVNTVLGPSNDIANIVEQLRAQGKTDDEIRQLILESNNAQYGY